MSQHTATKTPPVKQLPPRAVVMVASVIPGLGHLLLKDTMKGIRLLFWAVALGLAVGFTTFSSTTRLFVREQTPLAATADLWLAVILAAVLVLLMMYAVVDASHTWRQFSDDVVGAKKKPGSDHTPGGASKAADSRYTPDLLDSRPVEPSKVKYDLGMILVGFLIVVAIAGSGMDVAAGASIPGNMTTYVTMMAEGVFQFPDEAVREDWAASFEAMIESVAIAWIGTLIGASFSLPMGFLAARNMTPLGLYLPARFILSVIRAVPEIVFAIAITIPLFGYGQGGGGALAGAFALGISSIGTLSKLISEAIEGVDTGPVESSRASGANQAQTIRWAILPQVMPEIVAIWLYRFEVNIRASAILGTLGAGGIGVLLQEVFNRRNWDQIGIAIVVIIVVTILVDQISAFIRHRVIHGARAKAQDTDEN